MAPSSSLTSLWTATSLIALAACTASAQCLPGYNNAFRASVKGALFSWDLSPLCLGFEAYEATNKAGQNFTFQVGGNATSAPCSWDPSVAQFHTVGVAVQFFGPAAPGDCINWDTGEAVAVLFFRIAAAFFRCHGARRLHASPHCEPTNPIARRR